jgi:hypothetical protein
MKRLFVMIFLTLSLYGYSQDNKKLPPPPPPAASPKQDLIPLIDELIKVSELEKAFKDYCYLKILSAGSQLNWTQEQIKQKYAQVNFESFKNLTIYNNYSFLTKEDIEETIVILKKLNKNRTIETPFFISTSNLTNNMETYIKGILK